MSDLKLYGVSLQVTDTAGYQTFGVMAESKEDAVNRFRRGESTGEILSSEVEVIGLDKSFEIDDVEPYFDWKPEELCRCEAKDARIAELEGRNKKMKQLISNMDEYLDFNNITSISATSSFHHQMKDLLAKGGE